MRHAQQLDQNGHTLTVHVPSEYTYKKKGFSPWLSKASRMKTIENDQVAALFLPQAEQVHAASHSKHFTTLDIRVGGLSIRALLDSGATCSCMSQHFASQLGHPLTKANKTIGGLGGAVTILGTLNTDIKIRKYHATQTFQVLEKSIAGYDILLGQDFLKENEVGIKFSDSMVQLSFGDPASKNFMTMKQSTEGSKPSLVHRDSESALPIQVSTSDLSELVLPTPSSGLSQNERSKTNKKIRKQAQIAYRIFLTNERPAGADKAIPTSIQKVIDKHSCKGGTLCGKIPSNTHAKGYECNLEIKEGANPVYIRQYRLTPLEKTELLEQVDNFIEKGWLESSTSAWSSSVLFAPKPNGKLRFCLDYRKLNEVTSPNRSPLTNQNELLDSLQGMTTFSALDLASGYYQLKLGDKSRPMTAFPTPYGLMQWRVMPMGLASAPAVFQQAMNSILKEHIRNGYCLVYLDDIIIMSR